MSEVVMLTLPGLGGTSLINANVFLRPEPRTLELGDWPAEIRNNPAVLEQCKSPAFKASTR